MKPEPKAEAKAEAKVAKPEAAKPEPKAQALKPEALKPEPKAQALKPKPKAAKPKAAKPTTPGKAPAGPSDPPAKRTEAKPTPEADLSRDGIPLWAEAILDEPDVPLPRMSSAERRFLAGLASERQRILHVVRQYGPIRTREVVGLVRPKANEDQVRSISASLLNLVYKGLIERLSTGLYDAPAASDES